MKRLTEHLFLIGFMGVGKTSTSRSLSRKLGTPELDTDAVIVEEEGRSVQDIFAREGEDYFRRKETDLLEALVGEEPSIISCGGGMVMRSENIQKMKTLGKILFLIASPETIYSHVKDSTNRPLLNGNMNVEYIRELMESRAPRYQAAADLTVVTDNLLPWQVADKIIELL